MFLRPSVARFEGGSEVSDRARVVVIGGGVGGCSILYWLARLGWSDVILVERAQLTSGSTFHSAGLVGQLRSSLSLTQMMMNSVELYRDLSAEVELETGWREVGSLRLASSKERMEELQRQAAWAETFGLPLYLVSAEEAQKLFPPMSLEGVHGAALLATDGYLDPSQLTQALAKGARQRGATILTETRVTAIELARGAVSAVVTDKGRIECETVVNAGGIYAHEIGQLAGVDVPVVPMAHQYVITKPTDLPRDMPTLRDPSLLVYFRGESGGLLAGGYERNPDPFGLGGIAPDFNNRLLSPDWDRFAPLFEAAARRVPELADAEIVQLINGPEAFTPTASSSSGRRMYAGSGWRPGSAPMGSRVPGAWASSWPNGSSRANRASTHGRWTRAASAPSTTAATTPSSARRRSTPRTTTSSTPVTSAAPAGRCACRPPTRAL